MAQRRGPMAEKLWVLIRSSCVGVFATLSDLGTLSLLMGVWAVPHRVANVASLLPGLIVMFIGNKYFAFEDHSQQIAKQGMKFLFVEAWAFALNSLLFHVGAQAIELAEENLLGANLLRMVCTSIVYFGFSFPFWTFIFHKTAAAPKQKKIHLAVQTV